MNLSRIFAVMVAVFVGLCAMTALGSVYYTYVEVPFLSYTQLPFRVLTKEVKPGNAVLMAVLRCNSDSRIRTYVISHLLVADEPKGRALIMPATTVSIAPGCTEGLSSVNVIPVGTPAGKYHVEGISEVNGLVRTNLVGWRSEQFTVTP